MSRISRIHRHSLLLAAVAAAAAACTVGRDYEPKPFDAPQTWQQAADSTLTADAATDGPWWKTFGDAQLDELVDRALAQNLDLRAAFARLKSARALRGVAEADALPSLDARGGYEQRRESRNTPFGAFIPQTDIHTIAVDASWELDLWGRVRRSVEAASGELDASAADAEAAAITVAAEVVSAYVDLRAAQHRLKIARSNLALQEQTQSLVDARLQAGLTVERDAAQARTNVESTRARLPSLEASASAAENRLCVLLACAPGALPVTLADEAPIPTAPARIAVGVPADLLRRRPDVRAAERRFAAAVARIGAVDAERYPRLSLGGTLGLSANSASEVFDADSDLSAFGPSLRWNLFDGGRLRQRVAALEADAESMQVAWEQSVLLALEETENAMTRFVREQSRRASLQRAAKEARRAVELAETQYRAGLSDFQTVIDSERTVAAIEDDLAMSEAAIASGVVEIHKALGGSLGAPR